MPTPRVAEIRIRKVGEKAVIELPKTVLAKLGARPGDMLFWVSVDGTIQITKDNPYMTIPVMGSAEARFEPQVIEDDDEDDDDDGDVDDDGENG